ncbi:membrane protein DedA with SNARE-associated domain [Anaerobacterium chartisolvens]|uniref:Membrane protein DedA with SNARE-associated domain n=1 Tax=Anaerobacterium chartisolvens TaxID=1297424 RepID=A0A369BEU2_9FIRM|nr:DedA family protein [Anaerobacterium chartisolvens]RCX20062.1 membrane protein DedA with SNARE-associated domain [Anaerobacterium chartisolvens]
MEAAIIEFLKEFVEKNVFLVYFILFISSVLQMVFPPHPGDTILVFGGYVTTLGIFYSFPTVFLNAMAGTVLGSIVIYIFGYNKGSDVFKYRLIKRYVDEKHRKRADRIFKKYGVYAIVISKFVPGVNAIMLLMAGMFKVRRRDVYLSVVASTVVHHTLALLLGRFIGNNISRINSVLKTYNGIGLALLCVLTASGIVYVILKRKRAKA